MIGALFTAGRLGFAAVQGGTALVDALGKFGVRLALHSHAADTSAGDDMVELMRSRVPVDSGRLLNGIAMRVEGDTVIVEASAVRGDYDYARAVEFGHGVGHADPLGPPRLRRSRAEHGGRADAEPYFIDSAAAILEARGRSLDDAIGASAAEAGL